VFFDNIYELYISEKYWYTIKSVGSRDLRQPHHQKIFTLIGTKMTSKLGKQVGSKGGDE
jgi:hypothetical protein